MPPHSLRSLRRIFFYLNNYSLVAKEHTATEAAFSRDNGDNFNRISDAWSIKLFIIIGLCIVSVVPFALILLPTTATLFAWIDRIWRKVLQLQFYNFDPVVWSSLSPLSPSMGHSFARIYATRHLNNTFFNCSAGCMKWIVNPVFFSFHSTSEEAPI